MGGEVSPWRAGGGGLGSGGGIHASGAVSGCPPRVRMSRKLRCGRMRQPAYRRLLFAAFAAARNPHTCLSSRAQHHPVHGSLPFNYNSGNLQTLRGSLLPCRLAVP